MVKRIISRTFFHIGIVLFINLLFVLVGSISTFAACGDAGFVGPCPEPAPTQNSQDDLTKSTYMLNVSNLNPVKSSQGSGGNVTESGIGVVKVILNMVSSLLLFILPIIAAISLIVAGYYYILSSGDSEKATQAKTIIKWNVVAILIALFSYAIIKLIASVLGGNI